MISTEGDKVVDNVVPENLIKREEERRAELDRKSASKLQNSSETEQSDYIWSKFTSLRIEIETRLKNFGSYSNLQDGQTAFDNLSTELQILRKYFTDSVHYLPSYNARLGLENLNNLDRNLEILRRDLIPAKKFAFKKRVGGAKTDDSKAPDHKVIANSVNLDSALSIKDLKNEKIVKPCSGEDVELSKLENCEVIFQGCCNTIHVSDLFGCKLIGCFVTTSVFVENCSDCTFQFACQQLRIHKTLGSDFYLHVTSKAIIEDSKDVRFAPYRPDYQSLIGEFGHAKLDFNVNNWDKIDDFYWLAFDKQSPNWSVIPEEQRFLI